jgi:hypothetical protein
MSRQAAIAPNRYDQGWPIDKAPAVSPPPRHAKQLAHRPQLLAFRQQVRRPREERIRTDPLRLERHRSRDRESTPQADPGRLVSKARPCLVDLDPASGSSNSPGRSGRSAAPAAAAPPSKAFAGIQFPEFLCGG